MAWGMLKGTVFTHDSSRSTPSLGQESDVKSQVQQIRTFFFIFSLLCSLNYFAPKGFQRQTSFQSDFACLKLYKINTAMRSQKELLDLTNVFF